MERLERTTFGVAENSQRLYGRALNIRVGTRLAEAMLAAFPAGDGAQRPFPAGTGGQRPSPSRNEAQRSPLARHGSRSPLPMGWIKRPRRFGTAAEATMVAVLVAVGRQFLAEMLAKIR